MLKRSNIKPIVLFPLAIPAIIAYYALNRDAKQKVEKDVLMYWTHTIGPLKESNFGKWFILMTCNYTFRNVFYCRVSGFWRVILPWFIKPHPSTNINPTLSVDYGGGCILLTENLAELSQTKLVRMHGFIKM